MKNYKITIEYDGLKYKGFQKQGNTKDTIAQKFEDVLKKMCNDDVEIIASGRTDAGVHAKCQVANFKCETDLSEDEIFNYLNKYLPSDIRVTSLNETDMRFHSRLNAISKTYVYKIATRKPNVFIRKYVYFTDETLDISKMESAAKKLLGTHDFLGFSSLKKVKKSTVRTINYIDIKEDEGIITIKINGNGFLYNMVRIISGTLLNIAAGKLNENIIDEIFLSNTREMAGTTLPAYGLTLEEVFY